MAEHNPPLTQTALIEATKLGSHTVSRLCNNTFNRVDKSTVETLLNFFQCDVSDLFVTKDG